MQQGLLTAIVLCNIALAFCQTNGGLVTVYLGAALINLGLLGAIY